MLKLSRYDRCITTAPNALWDASVDKSYKANMEQKLISFLTFGNSHHKNLTTKIEFPF